jgi:small subunit ribosomal protein S15
MLAKVYNISSRSICSVNYNYIGRNLSSTLHSTSSSSSSYSSSLSSSSPSSLSSPTTLATFQSIRHFADETTKPPKEKKKSKKKEDEVAIELSDDNIPTLEWTPPQLSDEADPRAASRAKREERRQQQQMKIERAEQRRIAKLEKVKEQEKLLFEPDLRGIDVEKQNLLKDVLDVLPTETEEQKAFKERLARIGSFRTASKPELRKGRFENICAKYGKKPGDTGSTEVQVAILTERVMSLQKTVKEVRSNIHARRFLSIIFSRRRKLLKYLRRTNPISFEMIMKDLKLTPADVDAEGRNEHSGNQAKKIPRSG